MRCIIGCFFFFIMSFPVFAQQTLTLGIWKDRPQAIMEVRWKPLAYYLEQKLPEYKIKLKILSSEEINSAARYKQLDFVLTNPSHFIYLRQNFPLSNLLATLSHSYEGKEINALGGVIITRSDRNDIVTLDDIKGKTLVSSDVNALAEFQAQLFELLQKGISLNDIAGISFLQGSQDQAVYAVLEGQADIGFVRTGLVEEMQKEGVLKPELLKVINLQPLYGFPFLVSTRLYPNWPFFALPHVKPHTAHRFAAALLTLEDKAPSILRHIGIYGFSTAEDYSSVEEMMRVLKVPPFEYIADDNSLLDTLKQYQITFIISAFAFVIIVLLLKKLFCNHRKNQLPES